MMGGFLGLSGGLLLGSGGGGGGGGGGGDMLDHFAGDFTTQPWTSSATWPGAIYSPANDKTYKAWLAEGGPQVVRIMAYNHATDTWDDPVTVGTSPLVDDTHGQPAICELSDGRVAAFFGSHASNSSKFFLSDANDVTQWTEQTDVGSLFTYPKPVNVPDGSGGGTLYLFHRYSLYRLAVQSATYTSGGAISFGARTDLISFAASQFRIYAGEARLTADESAIEIFFAETANSDGSGRRHLSYVAYELTGANAGGIRNIDDTHSVASGSLPLTNRTTYEGNYVEVSTGDGDSEVPSWCYDTSGNKHVLYFNGSSDAGATYDLYHDRYVDGVGWDGATLVASLEPRGHPRLRYVSLVPGASDTVEAWYPKGETGGWTVAGGDNMVRRVRSSGGTWAAEETIVTGGGTHALAHPSSVHNAHADFRVIFGETAQTENFNDRGLFKRYAYGDSGFCQFPALSDSVWPYVVEQVVYTGTNGTTPTNLDQSWVRQPLAWSGNAQISGNRLSLDGSGDYTELNTDTANGENRRYYFDSGNFDAAFSQGGAFCFDLLGVKFASLSASQVIWARSGGAGARGLMLHYMGDLSPRKFRVYISANGSTASDLRFTWEPADTSTEYDIRVSRDSSGTIRVHIGTSGSALSLIGSDATFGTSAISPSLTLDPRHGSYAVAGADLNGSIRATRVAAHDRGTIDADVPAISFPLSTN